MKNPYQCQPGDVIYIEPVRRQKVDVKSLSVTLLDVWVAGRSVSLRFNLGPLIPNDKRISSVTWCAEEKKWFYHRDGRSSKRKVEVKVTLPLMCEEKLAVGMGVCI